MIPEYFKHLRSFRLRIALLSAAVSGVALAVFSSLTLTSMQRLSLARMDQDIKEFAHKHLTEPHGPGHWGRVSDSLRFFLRAEDENTFLFMVKPRNGEALYVSPNWPKDLPVQDFPDPDSWGEYPDPSTQPPPDAPPPEPPPDGKKRLEDPLYRAPKGPLAPLKIPVFSTRDAADTKWRIGMMGNPDITLVLGLNQRRLNEEVARVRHAFLAAFPIVLLLVAAGAWWVAQRALKPIEAVTKTIRGVKDKGLDQRISTREQYPEFSELITHFNDMMDWLETSFHQAIRFSADASHELKTPLTVLQAQLEQAVQQAVPGSDEQQRYVAFGKELQRLKSITQKLLLLSRIDAGELKFNLRPMDLSQMLEGIVEDTEILAPTLTIESELAPEVIVMADAELMKQVIQNLTANAIKYNHEGGFIRLQLRGDKQHVLLTVANSGPGILEEDRDKVFTRFFRGDKAHGRHVGGAGLGLSLAREIVRAHHGELTLEQSASECTEFLLTLPRPHVF